MKFQDGKREKEEAQLREPATELGFVTDDTGRLKLAQNQPDGFNDPRPQT